MTTPRIPALPLDEAPAPATPILAAVERALGRVPNLHRTLAHAPAALKAYAAMAEALAGGVLELRLREKLALATAGVNGCGYCTAAHTALGKGAGIDEAELARSRRGESSDPRDAAALLVANEMLAHRGRVPDVVLEGAREAGLGDAELVEIAAHVGMNTFTNLFNELVRTEVDFPAVATAG